MDKRTIWAFILILAVFWISSEFFWKQSVPASQQEVTASHMREPSQELPQQSAQPVEEAKPREFIDEQLDVYQESDIILKDDIILENDKMRITFTNEGASINSIILKDYYKEDKETKVDLMRNNSNLLGIDYADITGNAYADAPRMFNWQKTAENELVFSGESNFGSVKKSFTLVNDYRLDMTLSVYSNHSEFDYIIKFDDGIADTERYLKRKPQNYQVIFEVDNKVERYILQKLSKNQEITAKIDWAALRSKFFVIGIIKDELSQLYKAFAYSNNDSPAFRLYGRSPRPKLDASYNIYLGPVISDDMENMGNGFGSAYYAGNGIFFGQGFIKPISRLFNWIFRQFHQVIPNWGLCLIIFSVLIKIILYPLTHKSFESSTKLQKVQPQVTAIREKYKSDPQKMNQEMQRIYRENGVSPLGGCLPMLLQMPIFFALYPVIRYSIDLRQAGFLWLRDLSEPDPYLILPILMAVFMFLQQRMMRPSPSALKDMSEQQQAQMQSQKMMMYLMPALMFFLFKSFPGGLVLYWTVFNIMSMLQQHMIKRKFSN
jgi:YidC/Oxa1 family membrane protein insertase